MDCTTGQHGWQEELHIPILILWHFALENPHPTKHVNELSPKNGTSDATTQK